MRLTPRLLLAAELCAAPETVIDVGCDHGYLCAWLAEHGVCHAFASDIRPGPLEKAKETIAQAGLEDRITPVLCDGLSAFGPEDGQTVVICGMGGETIAAILEAAPWTADGRHRLVLQPMTNAPRLRAWLRQHGYTVRRERLAREGKRLYCVLEVWGGIDPAAPLYGDLFTASLRADPLFPAFAAAQSARYTRILEGKIRGEESPAEARQILRILKEQADGTGFSDDRRISGGAEPDTGGCPD